MAAYHDLSRSLDMGRGLVEAVEHRYQNGVKLFEKWKPFDLSGPDAWWRSEEAWWDFYLYSFDVNPATATRTASFNAASFSSSARPFSASAFSALPCAVVALVASVRAIDA